ncbi:raffinose/stachyose/melibiose transport system permease protein [Caldicoprobacter guelmensis]|uniref:carbohydrate ABC transporter permease n=1 Tax=Caldicoprobacter guelmensis TaxID=1170224 RepID=UPI0019570784|nr:carbohydrate ABC transporter permease [Caldicoprobacter guelmensis]MBM7583431.1 raffinose/stachyose/melibiose transport system permease protein [Caldicoprobacter guelmensis]
METLNLSTRKSISAFKLTKNTTSSLKVSKKAKVFIYIFMIIIAVIVLLPLIWLISSSLKTQAELTANVWGLPKFLHFENYVNAWKRGRMSVYINNSLIAIIVTIIITVVTSTTLSFVLSRLKFKGNRIIYYIVIIGMMIPIHAAVIPLYILAMNMKLQNNLIALGFIYAAFRISASVFFLESYMKTIPKELEESAIIDGCSLWRIFLKIILPLSKDGVITIVILAVIACWNELLVAMLMLNEPFVKTLPIGLMGFVTEYNAEYTQMCAGLVIACLPGLIFYALLQERIIKGMTVGAIKG